MSHKIGTLKIRLSYGRLFIIGKINGSLGHYGWSSGKKREKELNQLVTYFEKNNDFSHGICAFRVFSKFKNSCAHVPAREEISID